MKQRTAVKVFICYSKQDCAEAQALHNRLSEAGVDAWIDRRKLVLGDDFEHEIKKAVTEAHAFVACLRPGFDDIGFRQKEVRWAIEALQLRPPGRGFIIPFIIQPCDLPTWCTTIHAGSDLSAATQFEDVLRALEKHCGWRQRKTVPPKPRTPVKGTSVEPGPTNGAGLHVEPFFWLAQTFVAWTSSHMELAYEALESQAKSLSIEIDRHKLSKPNSVPEAMMPLADALRKRHGELPAHIFQYGCIVASLPFGFQSKDEFRKAKVVLEELALRFFGAEGLVATHEFVGQLPCEIPHFVKQVEGLKKTLQTVLDGHSNRGEDGRDREVIDEVQKECAGPPETSRSSEIESKVESAEAFESIGDVWSAAEQYEKLAAALEANNDARANEMRRRAKKCRSAAASIMRGD